MFRKMKCIAYVLYHAAPQWRFLSQVCEQLKCDPWDLEFVPEEELDGTVDMIMEEKEQSGDLN